MSSNYTDIAKTWGNVPKEQILPDGSYKLRFLKASYIEAKQEDKSDRVNFSIQPREPLDDVPQDALDDLGEDYDVTQNRIYMSFFLERGADYARVADVLHKLGIDTPETEDIKDTLKRVNKQEANGFVTSRTYTRNDGSPQTENSVTAVEAIE